MLKDMKHLSRTGMVIAWGVLSTLAMAGQDKGSWRAVSSTAKGVTGDVTFAGQKIAINFSAFTIAQIRELTPAEVSAVLHGDSVAAGAGHLYRTSIPAAKTFLHHNTLCGSEDTQWVVTVVRGHALQLAFFSGSGMPVLTADAMANTTDLCGTYTYSR